MHEEELQSEVRRYALEGQMDEDEKREGGMFAFRDALDLEPDFQVPPSAPKPER